MKISKRIVSIATSGSIIALCGVVLATGSGGSSSPTSLQNTTGNGALLDALGQPNTDLSVVVESGKKPNISFKVDGKQIPTDKPGVTPINHMTPDGGSVSGHVVTSGNSNSGNVNLNMSSQNSSYNVNTTVTPGDSANSNQTNTTTTFNNSFSNLNSNSYNSTSSFNSSTTYSNGQVQQSP